MRCSQLGMEQAAIRLKPFIDQNIVLSEGSVEMENSLKLNPTNHPKMMACSKKFSKSPGCRKSHAHSLWRAVECWNTSRTTSDVAKYTSSQLPQALHSRHASRKCPRGLPRPMPRPERLSENFKEIYRKPWNSLVNRFSVFHHFPSCSLWKFPWDYKRFYTAATQSINVKFTNYKRDQKRAFLPTFLWKWLNNICFIRLNRGCPCRIMVVSRCCEVLILEILASMDGTELGREGVHSSAWRWSFHWRICNRVQKPSLEMTMLKWKHLPVWNHQTDPVQDP